tara:strand:- start:780 stop:1208 length:429 start_codon:yes stop_codon:yes gene_type:complete
MPDFLTAEVKPEKYRFRDERLSNRHRLYGSSCPMVDLDFIVIEYHLKKSVALIEYKHWRGESSLNLQDANYQALMDMADKAELPFFISYYHPETWNYIVYPTNMESFKWILLRTSMTEKEYVKFLYKLRYLKVKQDILDKLL